MTPLVSVSWLRERLGTPQLRVVDATYYLPNEAKDAAALFAAGHIPGAGFFDIDAVAETSSGLPHMLPSPEVFAAAVGALGIGNASQVVVYDQRGVFSSARLWWMFQVFGHDAVAVLDGGLPAWREAGSPLETGPATSVPARFTVDFRPHLVRSLAQMRDNVEHRRELVLDARAAGRFDGSVPEPRPGMRSGHIPGARSLPFTALLENQHFLPPAQLAETFAAAGVTPGTPVVTSCGSGVTAAVLTLGMVLAGLQQGSLYDGSWSEWGARADTPVEV
ncbi:MAG TPA: 3-mercaptopyruvate sulfurtransferase [Acidocella sp.]|nr:MAG: 3-mercaptopyruvate sulfurtransferase [Acidocella sp. 20-61-6]HQT47673.1 3-mercaptopyruvate sulfurtransferase [Acidocella sp.]